MKRLALVLFLIVTPALAQSEKTYTLTVSDAELQIPAEALGEMPAKKVNPLINRINQQILLQTAAAKKAGDTKPADPAK